MKRKAEHPLSKIRTGSGDKGTTFLKLPKVSKGSAEVEFVGDLDEACALLGGVECNNPEIQTLVEESKTILFVIGACLHSLRAHKEHLDTLDEYVEKTSALIKTVGSNIPVKLEGFIIPDRHNYVVMHSRAVVRRAERSAVRCNEMWAVPVLNTMSDLLFLVAWHDNPASDQWKGF